MLTSLGIIFLVGLSMAAICKKLGLPRIIGMLISGIVLGPYVLDFLDGSILGISAELRQMALVIILIKAGLSLDLAALKKVGRPAVLMAFLPAVFEIAACVLFAPMFLGVSYVDAAVMGAVLGAVSPAVVVPRMVDMMEKRCGTEKGIPQMILAGASLDDVFVIVLFTTFLSMAEGAKVDVLALVNIPVAIILGIGVGAGVGLVLAMFFEWLHGKGYTIKNSVKVIILLSVSFLLLAVEGWLEGIVSVSGLLAIMSMALVVALRSVESLKTRLQQKFGKLWIAAEVLLFVLVGAAVDIRYTVNAGGMALLLILVCLVVRSIGVWLCLLKTPLNGKERLFCCLAYLPKATVQAAIGGVPLAMGLGCGSMVLSVAVLSILVTAPLGAIGIDWGRKHLLGEI